MPAKTVPLGITRNKEAKMEVFVERIVISQDRKGLPFIKTSKGFVSRIPVEFRKSPRREIPVRVIQ
ncbi:MAG: hypothetical protein COV69_03300 [Parcubacteria group bacterium CG11_big_fil_rev_8_21_14_0_20_39_14]|nr:MAG: hypothetical protein COV69_03300 [Parcubacteria group bacterium CG11_big_fil_rev_8_21_14_0_20_39_14]